jgi:hypothetical protein
MTGLVVQEHSPLFVSEGEAEAYQDVYPETFVQCSGWVNVEQNQYPVSGQGVLNAV